MRATVPAQAIGEPLEEVLQQVEAERRAAEKAEREEAGEHRLAAIEASSPWWTLSESARYEKRGKRWLAAEATAGRVRCCRVGGKRELMFRREWLDEHMEAMSRPIMLPVRRHGR